MDKSPETYNSSKIKALNQHQHLLKRVSLIFGSVENPGVEYSSQKGVLLRELLDNGLDEVRGGYGEWLKISFFKDRSFEVHDSGRGIPVDTGHDAEGKPASGIYLSLGLLQSGGKFETDAKRFSSGLNGLGGSASIHCSKAAVVRVYRSNKVHELHFQDGTPGFFANAEDPDSAFTPLKDLTKLKITPDKRPTAEKKKYKSGTAVRVWIRDEVFSSSNPYDDQDIIQRLRGTAFLVPRLHAEVYNELNTIDDKPQEEYYHFPNGVEDLVELNQPDTKLHELIHIVAVGKYSEKNVAVLQDNGTVKSETLERTVPIEVAMRYGDKYEPTVSTFVNTIHTKLNGVHLTAFERALQASFGERFKSMRGLMKKGELEEVAPEDFLEGLTAILSVQVAEPVFTSQSKEALSGREVQKAIQEVLTTEFQNWINDRKNADQLNIIAQKVTTAAKNRLKAKEQRDLNRKKNEISSSSLPVKLVDCELSGSEDAELYIAEGESAKSSLKEARDGRVHALLPIRGKIINARKSGSRELLNNKEVSDIIKTLGAGTAADFDLDKMRYGRVFVATDADPDGNAIACLLYALFWQLFRPVILEGRFYKIETPLFVFNVKARGGEKIYARDERERDSIRTRLEKQGKRYTVTRVKGLGELKADDMYMSALNPETRIITQVTIDDAEEAERMLEVLLGKEAFPRKAWIEQLEIDEELLGE